ncbi:hypothetical protein TNCV_3353731 [Trichonephila clavipes]|nr:hypothetical protein TNCV_3353731 [Trichonephila clavipes]
MNKDIDLKLHGMSNLFLSSKRSSTPCITGWLLMSHSGVTLGLVILFLNQGIETIPELVPTLQAFCKEQLPAPGNRSNERRYREKDLATTEEKKVGTGEKRGGDEKSRGRER